VFFCALLPEQNGTQWRKQTIVCAQRRHQHETLDACLAGALDEIHSALQIENNQTGQVEMTCPHFLLNVT
jgi:hypothetical protein